MAEFRWSQLTRVGGAALVAAGVLYVSLLAAVVAVGGLPTTGIAMLEQISDQATLIRVVMAAFVVIDLSWLVALPALYVAVMDRDRGWPVVAWVVAATGALLDIISSLWIFSFPDFSAAYQAADAQLRSTYIPTGELFFTYVFRVETPFAVAMQALGVLVLSAVMLRGPLDRRVAYLGLVTAALAVVGGFAGQIPALFLLIPWLIAAGIGLFRLGAGSVTETRLVVET